MGRTVRVVALAAVLVAALALAGLPAAGAAAAVQAGTSALADFNGDGIDDLVVGVPLEDLGGTLNAGVVDVIYGSESGLADGGRQQLTQALPEAGDAFGSAVTTGDFNGDIFTDLAVGVPGENVGATADAGAISLIESADDGSGLPAGAVQERFFQGSGGVPGASETGDRFGAALAGGLFGSGGIDLAVGVPGEDVGSAVDAGAVVVLVSPTLHQLLTQGGATTIGSVPGATESGDRFGAALATGDFDGNNADNLAIGAPGEDLGTVADAGAVISLCGSEGLLESCPDGVLTQGNPEQGDSYGAALTPGNFDGNEFFDLAARAPGETVAGAVSAGAADARDGAIGGLPAAPDEPLYFQGNDGVPGTAEAGDLFAAALSA